MRRYLVAFDGEIPVLDVEVSPGETPEQAAARLLGPQGVDVRNAEVVTVDDR